MPFETKPVSLSTAESTAKAFISQLQAEQARTSALSTLLAFTQVPAGLLLTELKRENFENASGYVLHREKMRAKACVIDGKRVFDLGRGEVDTTGFRRHVKTMKAAKIKNADGTMKYAKADGTVDLAAYERDLREHTIANQKNPDGTLRYLNPDDTVNTAAYYRDRRERQTRNFGRRVEQNPSLYAIQRVEETDNQSNDL